MQTAVHVCAILWICMIPCQAPDHEMRCMWSPKNVTKQNPIFTYECCECIAATSDHTPTNI
eukprot:1904355-Amphidinium_carterae.2